MNWTNEALFCVRYLYERGYLDDIKPENMNLLLQSAHHDYQLVELPKDEFFPMLARELRKLWPSGEKDGKYPWRDSEANLVKRLRVLWTSRHLKNYSLDFCLEVARRYLAKFQDNTKYMQILKYFIYKQIELKDSTGKIKYNYSSRFADMLEGKDEEDAVLNAWQDCINTTVGEGMLV